MRHLKNILALILLLSLLLGINQCEQVTSTDSEARQLVYSVASDSGLTPEESRMYRQDAARLAAREMLADPVMDSTRIRIPEEWEEIYYRSLLLVRNAENLIGTPDIKDFHTFMHPVLYPLIVEVDSTAEWASAWREGNLMTGNPAVDTLVENYKLSLSEVDTDYGLQVILKSADPLNMYALGTQFSKIDGVQYAEPNAVVGDGSDIEADRQSTVVMLTYWIKWGDCMAGCINGHYWRYQVRTQSGRVEYLGSGGDPLP